LPSATRIIGPDFLDPESREAFERIAETIRQYTVHSRETIVLARNPFVLAHDHITLLWSHGAAIIFLFHRGGKITGSAEGSWTETSTEGPVHSERHFENPLILAAEGCQRLVEFLQAFHKNRARVEDASTPAVDHWNAIGSVTKTIALFTRPVTQLEIGEGIKDPSFIATTLEHVTSRTIFHLPNLLRITDSEDHVFDTQDLQLIGSALEREAAHNEGERENKVNEATTLIRVRRSLRRQRGMLWAAIIVALSVTTVVIVLVMSRGSKLPSNKNAQPVLDTSRRQTPESKSTVVIKLQEPEQLFVAPNKFDSRTQLDDAIANGLGLRSYPSVEHVLTLDSVQFARGVYGYFKVDNKWRKGKLLQTFNDRDTFKIDNYLAPLP